MYKRMKPLMGFICTIYYLSLGVVQRLPLLAVVFNSLVFHQYKLIGISVDTQTVKDV